MTDAIKNIVRAASLAAVLLDRSGQRQDIPTNTAPVRMEESATDTAIEVLDTQRDLFKSDFSASVKAELHVHVGYVKILGGVSNVISSAYVLYLYNTTDIPVYLSGVMATWYYKGIEAHWRPYTYSSFRLDPKKRVEVRLAGQNYHYGVFNRSVGSAVTVLGSPAYDLTMVSQVERLGKGGEVAGFASLVLPVDTQDGNITKKTLPRIDCKVVYDGSVEYQGSANVIDDYQEYERLFQFRTESSPFDNDANRYNPYHEDEIIH